MKKFTSENFWKQVYEIIKKIEENSVVEIVVIAKPQSLNYDRKLLWISFIISALYYSFLMFSPIEFHVYFIYFSTVLSFPLVFLILWFVKPLKRALIGKKQIEKNTEIYARALFQKAGIRFTEKRIGILFFISIFEKKIIILPDRGAKLAIPAENWNIIYEKFSKIFDSKDCENKFLEELENLTPIFNKYLPPVENDINELPDNIKIDL